MKDDRAAYNALMKFYPLTLEDLGGEEWRVISKHYQVSSFGRVKSFWNGKQRILKPKFNGHYLTVCLILNSNRKYATIHKLVAQTFIPKPDDKFQVNHLDGNKMNNYVSNLEWVTASENQRHAVLLGLKPQGGDCRTAKLSAANVLYIRANPDDLTGSELATMFGVSAIKISEIQLGKKYRNVGGIIRPSKKGTPRKISVAQRQEIQRLYIPRHLQFGATALSKKYGVHENTILRIVKALNTPSN